MRLESGLVALDLPPSQEVDCSGELSSWHQGDSERDELPRMAPIYFSARTAVAEGNQRDPSTSPEEPVVAASPQYDQASDK